MITVNSSQDKEMIGMRRQNFVEAVCYNLYPECGKARRKFAPHTPILLSIFNLTKTYDTPAVSAVKLVLAYPQLLEERRQSS
jgi:hypothetical protein